MHSPRSSLDYRYVLALPRTLVLPSSTPLFPRAPRGILVIRIDPPDLGLVENIERSISRQRWASLRRSLVCPSYVDFAHHFIPHLLLDDMDGDIMRAVLRANSIQIRWSSWWNFDSQILTAYEMGLKQYPDLFETGSFSPAPFSNTHSGPECVCRAYLDATLLDWYGDCLPHSPIDNSNSFESDPPDVFCLPIVPVGMR